MIDTAGNWWPEPIEVYYPTGTSDNFDIAPYDYDPPIDPTPLYGFGGRMPERAEPIGPILIWTDGEAERAIAVRAPFMQPWLWTDELRVIVPRLLRSLFGAWMD